MIAAGQVRAYRRVPGLDGRCKAGGQWRAEVGKTFKHGKCRGKGWEAALKMLMFRRSLEPVSGEEEEARGKVAEIAGCAGVCGCLLCSLPSPKPPQQCWTKGSKM